MPLLHVTDFQFDRPWFDWLARVAPEYEVCCLSGDLLDLLSDWDVSPTRQVLWVGSVALGDGLPVVLLPGGPVWRDRGPQSSLFPSQSERRMPAMAAHDKNPHRGGLHAKKKMVGKAVEIHPAQFV